MKVEDPLSGWPATRPLDGTPGYRVSAKHLTPHRLRLTDFVIFIVLLGSLGLFFWTMFGGGLDSQTAAASYTPAGIAWLVGAFALAAGRKTVGRWLFGKTTVLEFQPDHLSIKSMFGSKNYDLRMPHKFIYDIHEFAEFEAKQEIKAQHKAQRVGRRELPDKTHYYRDSFELFFVYGGLPVKIATVTGKRQADALLGRLLVLDQVMDGARGIIGGTPISEANRQYGERPEAG